MNLNSLAIVGAGGHARSIFSWLSSSNVNFNNLYFVDKYKKKEDEKIFNHAIIQKDWNCIDQINIDAYLIAIGDNDLREQLFNLLIKKDKKIVDLIHNSAILGIGSKLGRSIAIGPLCIVGPLVVLKDNIIVNSGAIIEHESIIGSHSHIAPGAKIAGRVIMGNNVFLGIGAIIKENIVIGNNVIIGAGAVVINDVPSNSVVAGVPAKLIRKLD
ncbi:acetyltransferase [Lysinibacillus fusiformis]|uniref:acetyltransferase n=1 Tax=Lysinibacillus fusiformis TaxID=28031 RepID=UPI00148D6939|nr:acetyltransferase [Lysinibacillus fusiformis]NOG29142.1 acetyltransferase [Lysinibacillus fusiformis]